MKRSSTPFSPRKPSLNAALVTERVRVLSMLLERSYSPETERSGLILARTTPV